jgi:hypothetical protein
VPVSSSVPSIGAGVERRRTIWVHATAPYTRTGGTLALTREDDGSYTLRLDAAPTVVGTVTVELSGLTGRATFDAQTCPSSNGWWL